MMRRRLLPTVLATAAGLLAAAPALAAGAPATAPPVKPVRHVELSRYTGSWFQLAAIPQWFSLACVRDTTATYTARPDGTVGVLNRCITAAGTPLALNGRARVTDPVSNAQLQVTFLHVGSKWVYLGGTNYVIIGLARDYSWAVTTDPDRTSAFVLSRTPTLPHATQRRIRRILRANGINPCWLQVTPVTGGAEQPRPAC
jgi:apolipoprotein D and lipocalin family protein